MQDFDSVDQCSYEVVPQRWCPPFRHQVNFVSEEIASKRIAPDPSVFGGRLSAGSGNFKSSGNGQSQQGIQENDDGRDCQKTEKPNQTMQRRMRKPPFSKNPTDESELDRSQLQAHPKQGNQRDIESPALTRSPDQPAKEREKRCAGEKFDHRDVGRSCQSIDCKSAEVGKAKKESQAQGLDW